ncbi:MAG: TAXI family TRAP transporter solute-binding subunit [Desulfobacteraceae bacterium]|nr:TAXI family TRAP transporter solute-binding subunit [Desulfobacteraceae bacterium]
MKHNDPMGGITMRHKALALSGSVCLIIVLALLLFTPAFAKSKASADKIEIQIYSNPFGHTTYVLSFALAEIINKNSTRLHMTCVESKGSSANILYMQKNPAARKYTMVVANPFAANQAAKADPPFKKPFTGLKAVSMIGNMCGFFLTTNPEIKTIQDLAGKRVTLGIKGITIEYIPRFILKYGYGIYDDLGRVSHMSFDGIKNALIDGTTDAGLQSSVMWGEEEYKNWVPIPTAEELLSTKKCYLVDIEEGAFKKAREKSGYPLYFLKAKPKAFGKSAAFGGNRIWWSNSWWVHESMDDDVVREICSIVYDHAKDFVTYHASGRGITQKTLASVAVPEADFHPAAAKFYREKGHKVGQ